MELRFIESERARFGYRMARLNLDSGCERADAERIVKMCLSSKVGMLTLPRAHRQDFASCADREMASCVYLPIVAGTIAGFITMRRNSSTFCGWRSPGRCWRKSLGTSGGLTKSPKGFSYWPTIAT